MINILSRNMFPVATVAGLWLATANLVFAQAPAIDQPVLERDRPAVDAQGIPAGSFRFYPLIALTGTNNDNVLADDTVALDDTVFQISPQLTLESDWNSHQLIFGASADIASYSDIDSEDFEDSRFWLASRIDGQRTEIFLNGSTADLHEDRSSPNDKRGIEPTTYTENAVDGSIRYRHNRFSIRAGADIANFEFDDVQGIGEIIDNSDRDRRSQRYDLRLGYSVQPALDLFAEFRQFETDYDQTFDNDGFERSSEGSAVVAGLELDVTGKLRGELYFGSREYEYDDPRFSDSDGPTFGADLTWNVSGLTTILLSADQRVDAALTWQSQMKNLSASIGKTILLRRELRSVT
jgi:hypothetical protein